MRNSTLAIVVGLAAVLALAVAAHVALAAGGKGGGGCMGGLERLGAVVGATDAQKAEIRPIVANAQAEAQAIRADSSLSAQDRTSKLLDLRRETREKVLAVFTPDQRATLHTMVAERMGDALGLTPTQKDQVKTIHMDSRTKADAIRADNSLTDAQRRAALEDLHKSTMAQVDAVLTPDQQAKMAQMKSEWNSKNPCEQPTG